MTPETHIVKAYTAELAQLVSLIAEMGGYAEAAVAEAVQGLRRRDSAQALRVVEGDRKIDALEVQISAFVVRLLALRQPMATDLRTIVAGLKTASDLERIGDYAKNIGKRSLVLNRTPISVSTSGITNLSRMVEAMLHDVLDAYVAGDADAAEQVRLRDQDVDDAHNALFGELINGMIDDPRTISASTHLVFIAKNLERIGDHATNIAENLVFQVRGERLTDRHAADEGQVNLRLEP